jgi:hypothetical protein
MALAHIYEGTAEEIAEQLRGSNLTGKLRATVVPENGAEIEGKGAPGVTLAERLKGRVGLFDFGDANLSEDTGRKFSELLAEKHRKGQL